MKAMEFNKDYVLNRYYNCWLIKELLTEDEWKLALPFLQGLAKLLITQPRMVMNEPVEKQINLDGCLFNVAELVMKYRTPYHHEMFQDNQVDSGRFVYEFMPNLERFTKCCVFMTQSWYRIDGNAALETVQTESEACFNQFSGLYLLHTTNKRILDGKHQAGQLTWEKIERDHFLREESDYMTFAKELGEKLAEFTMSYDMKVS